MSLPAPATDRAVLVTGASSGIGAALAEALAERGHGVILVARREDRLDDLAERLADRYGVQAAGIRADLARSSDRRSLLKAVERDGRDVVGLCNNAGVSRIGPFLEQSPEARDAMIRLNVNAVQDLTSALLPRMVDRGAGAILNVASIFAVAPVPGQLVYAATKAFMQSFSEGLHAELAGTGVSCTALFPGPTRTDVFDAPDAAGLGDLGPGLVWQEPEEVAATGVRAMIDGRRTATPGWTNQAASIAGRLVPRTLYLPAVGLLRTDQARRMLRTITGA